MAPLSDRAGLLGQFSILYSGIHLKSWLLQASPSSGTWRKHSHEGVSLCQTPALETSSCLAKHVFCLSRCWDAVMVRLVRWCQEEMREKRNKVFNPQEIPTYWHTFFVLGWHEESQSSISPTQWSCPKKNQNQRFYIKSFPQQQVLQECEQHRL